MNKNFQFKQRKLARLLDAVTLVARSGGLDFDDWMQVDQTRENLDNAYESFKKRNEELDEKYKLKDYRKKLSDLEISGKKKYTPTADEQHNLTTYMEDREKLLDTEVEVKCNLIPIELIKNLNEEAWPARVDIMVIVDKTETKKTAGAKK